MNRMRGWLGVMVVSAGCTEPNPYAADGSTGSTDDATMSSSNAMTTMSSSVTATGMTDPTTDATATDTASDATMGTADPTGDPTGDPTTDPTAESTGTPVCAAGTHLCVAEAPMGWTGPAAILPSDAATPEPDCAGDWPDQSAVAFTDLQATAATCDCECADSNNAACTSVSLQRYDDIDDDCSAVQASWSTGTACAATPASAPDMQEAGNAHRWRATALLSSGTCTPMPTEEISPAEFAARLTLCAAPNGSADGCEATEQCLPIPDGDYDGRICVWQAGDLECPDGPWTERTLLHQDIADDRDCSACTCGAAVGECSGTLNLANASNCSGQLVVGVPVNSASCTLGVSALSTLGAAVSGAGLTPVDPTCPPSNSSPIGDAEAISPMTVCCLP